MRQPIRLFQAAAAILLFLSLVFVSPSQAQEGVKLPDDCMPLSEIRIGMKGEALSVVQGFEPSVYKVEIIGIEQGALPGSSMILSRLEGPRLEKHGIVAGMSGSPVYINGKCIGAVAYGWSFSYVPIAGITPIEHMLTMWDELDRPVDVAGTTSERAGASSETAWDWRADWKRYLEETGEDHKPEPIKIKLESPGASQALGVDTLEMIPLSAPFFSSGASKSSVARLQKFFASRGLELFEAGSGAGSNASPAEASPPLRGGSTIAIPLLTGDTTIASMGTVTYRSGDKLLAFGHPMFGEGKSHAPMGPGYVFDYLQSYMRSFKLGEAREIVGTIRQDRTFAIGGVFGETPERVEMTVKVGGGAATRPRSYKFSVWEDRDFMPQLVAMALDSAVASSVSEAGEATGKFNYTIRLADGDRIEKGVVATTRMSIGFEFAMAVLEDLFMLEMNPFKRADLDSIEATMEVEHDFHRDVLIRVTPRYTTLKPGQTLELDTVWRPFRAAEYMKRIAVKIPEKLQKGTYIVHLADAFGTESVDERHEPTGFRATNYEETLRLVKRLHYPSNRLTAFLYEPDMSLGVKADALEGMPDSMAGLVAATTPGEWQSLAVGRQLSRETTDFENPIAGRASLAINVTPYLPQ